MQTNGTHNKVLYVNADGRGDERLMHAALSEALPGGSSNFENTAWDRWDGHKDVVFGAGTSAEHGATYYQLLGYDRILWDGGAENWTLNYEDGSTLQSWLALGTWVYPRGLYLAGDDIVENAADRVPGDPVRQLMEQTARVGLRCRAFRRPGCPSGSLADLTPCLTLRDLHGARTVNPSRLSLHRAFGNGCPEFGEFDLLWPLAAGPYEYVTEEERYEGDVKAGLYASIANSYENIETPGGGWHRTIVDGMSVLRRRDSGECVMNPGNPPVAMVERLREVLAWLGREGQTTGIGDAEVVRIGLPAPARNPVSGGAPVRIHFTLAETGPARVAVYSLSGALVKEVFDGAAERGENEAIWNLRDDQGRTVSPGVYFYRLEADGQRFSRKLVVVGGP
jgi:hypothetical protein